MTMSPSCPDTKSLKIGEESQFRAQKKQRESRKLYDVAKRWPGTRPFAWLSMTPGRNDGKTTISGCKNVIRAGSKDWVLPRGKHASMARPFARSAGLSSPRLSAFVDRVPPQSSGGFFLPPGPARARAETKEQFGQSALDALEHLREQRVKQPASRCRGGARYRTDEGGPWEAGTQSARAAAVDEPCHAIVIENPHPLPAGETRTRRENRQLMTWSSSKVKKYLSEACQLHGLHLREVSAAYTSRQDSTQAPASAVRMCRSRSSCDSPFWRKRIAQAEKKQAEGKGDARERFICDLSAKWKEQIQSRLGEGQGHPCSSQEVARHLLSGRSESPAAKEAQADLNAAANIGLRATDRTGPASGGMYPAIQSALGP
ncbi:type V CRISPR-associated protein Cas12b [bacterium]|nr:type V CRISPR-associated protein Cas12b [bacterium]